MRYWASGEERVVGVGAATYEPSLVVVTAEEACGDARPAARAVGPYAGGTGASPLRWLRRDLHLGAKA